MAKILIVDDDEGILDAISLILESEEYTVQTSLRGEETYRHVDNFNPDLILLDVLLSGVDGREICKKLKQNLKTQNIPVIMVSAHPSAQESAFRFGANDFLAKPFETEALLRKIKKNLD